MKKACLFFILVLVITGFSYATCYADIIHVPSDYPTIQAGIDAASDGDTVLVADGTWTGDGNKNLDLKGKVITVTSENGAENCIIDCKGDGRGFYFHNWESNSSVVDGFSVTNGFVEDRGGGIYCRNSSPTITNNIIINNSALEFGGGIYCSISSAKITNNVIRDNSAGDNGNGISVGGGTYGMIIASNIITNNSGSNGGGVSLSVSDVIIKNNIIARNSVNLNGGGIYCQSGTPLIINNTIVGNSANENGGGIYCISSMPTVINTILWANTAEIGNQIYVDTDTSSIAVTYSDVQGGWEGEGNIDANPLFVDTNNGDYHLQAGSPCIDAGTSSGAPPDDIEGQKRDEFPDMGAYEYQKSIATVIEIISPADGDEYYVEDLVDVIAEVRDRLGTPMPDVEVTFEARGGIVDPVIAITDENGQVATQLTVAEGENVVTARITEYPEILDTVTVIGVVPVSFINGIVTDTEGNPIEDATIIIINEITQDKALTDGDGYYESVDLPVGIYWIICLKKGSKVGLKKAEVIAGETTTVDFQLAPR
jgi:hypothetical protein